MDTYQTVGGEKSVRFSKPPSLKQVTLDTIQQRKEQAIREYRLAKFGGVSAAKLEKNSFTRRKAPKLRAAWMPSSNKSLPFGGSVWSAVPIVGEDLPKVRAEKVAAHLKRADANGVKMALRKISDTHKKLIKKLNVTPWNPNKTNTDDMPVFGVRPFSAPNLVIKF